MDLAISNVINISVSAIAAGAGNYNTSNVALFSHEVPGGGFGSDGYKIYLEPSEVGVDFGTESETYKMALGVFSQQPNILANRGYLVVIPMISEVQQLAFDAVADGGDFEINFDGDGPQVVQWDDDAATIQANLRANIAGMENVVVTGSIASQTLTLTLAGYEGPAPLVTITNNNLVDGVTPIVITPSEVTDGEELGEAISRTKDLVQYFGIMATFISETAEMLSAAAVVQTLNKIAFFVSRTEADVDPGGRLDQLRTGTLTKSRGLYYGADNDSDALVMMASYVGRGLSVVFEGSNTTITMHLKTLASVQPDPSMTQTILNKCKDAGADTYISIQGNPRVFSVGANDFFDNVYNLGWFVGALEIAGFNTLSQVGTKIAQTEGGVDQLKSAYRKDACEIARNNQFVAPGAWTSPTTFGNQADFFNNIEEFGYYIYSTPVAQQSAAARADREAPLVQIAIKYAGALHSSSVIVNVNA